MVAVSTDVFHDIFTYIHMSAVVKREPQKISSSKKLLGKDLVLEMKGDEIESSGKKVSLGNGPPENSRMNDNQM